MVTTLNYYDNYVIWADGLYLLIKCWNFESWI